MKFFQAHMLADINYTNYDFYANQPTSSKTSQKRASIFVSFLAVDQESLCMQVLHLNLVQWEIF